MILIPCPSIPRTNVRKLVHNLLMVNSTNPVIKSQMLALSELCLNQTNVLFNDILYGRNKGLIMEYPSSPFLTKLFTYVELREVI